MGTELESQFQVNESFHFFFIHMQNYLQIHESDMRKFNNNKKKNIFAKLYNLLYLFRIYKEMEMYLYNINIHFIYVLVVQVHLI